MPRQTWLQAADGRSCIGAVLRDQCASCNALISFSARATVMWKQLLIYVIRYSSFSLDFFIFQDIFNVYIPRSLSLEDHTTRLTASYFDDIYAAVQCVQQFAAHAVNMGEALVCKELAGPIPFSHPSRRSSTTLPQPLALHVFHLPGLSPVYFAQEKQVRKQGLPASVGLLLTLFQDAPFRVTRSTLSAKHPPLRPRLHSHRRSCCSAHHLRPLVSSFSNEVAGAVAQRYYR